MKHSLTHSHARTLRERTTVLTGKGQVTIPQEIRERLGLKKGDQIVFELEDDSVRLRLAPSRLLRGYGAVSPRRQPEDFQALRREFEHGVAAEASSEI